MIRSFISTITALLVFAGSLLAQQRISVHASDTSLQTVIDQIEKQVSVRFYYLPAWIDTINVTVNVDNADVAETLNASLSNTGIHYYIHGSQIILTPSIQITDHADSLYKKPSRNLESTLPDKRSRLDLNTDDDASRANTIIDVGSKNTSARSPFTLTGYVKEKRSGEPLAGVLVHVNGVGDPVMTNAFGLYTLSVPAGSHTVEVELVGMRKIAQRINMHGNGKVDFDMVENVTQLKEVVVESDGDLNVSGVQMGVTKIDVRTMKNIPKILGENDLLKVATTLPGVKTVGEGASGINVRGGHADQNLVILNEATIYNTSHFLGFFSVFNPDAIRSFELYKSSIPVQHGGRLSSTFELLMRDGNQKKFSGQGGVGPITANLTLEGPIIKDKTSIMVGGRTTYSNWVLRAIPESVIRNTRANFYDLFARVTHKVNENNTIYLSLYESEDKFNLSSDTLFRYSNRLASLQWRHVFNPSLDMIVSATHSRYDYHIDYNRNPLEGFGMGFSVAESNAKIEFNKVSGKHKIGFGIQSKLYELSPGFLNRASDSSLIAPRAVQHEKGLESSLFLGDNFDLSPGLSLYAGVRYSTFAALGPRKVYAYTQGVAKSEATIQDSAFYANNDIIKTFHGPEYRAALRYKVNEESSLKASYNRTRQYIHMLSNTVSVSPTDTWKLSDPNVKPQVADQLSLGYYRDLKKDIYEFSAEIYYKWIQNILDYKTGATLLVNEHIDQQVLQGKGKAYGIELLIRKKSGKFTGWLGYSYSRTFIQLNSTIPSERVNGGRFFPANYDKPHDATLISNYKITRRYSLALNFTYSTGRPITYPIALYRFGNAYRVTYSDRNAYRIPDYIRADIGFNMEGNHKIKKLAHSFWTVSIYNVLGRRNPYSIYFINEGEKIKAYKLSIFGAPIATITYHFKF